MKKPRWTPKQDAAVLDALEDRRLYRDLPAVAASIGRSPGAVKVRLYTVLRPKFGKMPDYTATEAARQIGVSVVTASKWCAEGALRAVRGDRKCGRGAGEWVVTAAAVADFLADPRYWPRWSVAKVAPAWRAHAREVRTGELLSLPAAAKRLYVGESTLGRWVREGKVTTYPPGAKQQRRLRVEDVEELARRLAA